MLHFQLIGVQKLIVEMDASSTCRTLQNPDMALSAMMNRWIASINMFHFDLVHVPGEHHTLDGLSRRLAQPGDMPMENDGEESKDWIDSVYSFLNIILPPPYLGNAPLLTSGNDEEDAMHVVKAEGAIETSTIAGTVGKRTVIEPLDYATIPQSQVAKDFNVHVQDVQHWLELGKLPLMNSCAKQQWQKYVSQFFAKDGKMWRVTRENLYQRVLEPSRHVKALVNVHDYLGHCGIYAMLAFGGLKSRQMSRGTCGLVMSARFARQCIYKSCQLYLTQQHRSCMYTLTQWTCWQHSSTSCMHNALQQTTVGGARANVKLRESLEIGSSRTCFASGAQSRRSYQTMAHPS